MLAAALAIMVGLLLRWRFSRLTCEDDWVIWWDIQRHLGHSWIQKAVSDSICEGERGYPQLQQFIVGRLPARHRRRIGSRLNAVYDVLTSFVICILATQVYAHLRVGPVAGVDPAALAVLLFVTCPILFPIESRMVGIKARSLGLLLLTFYFAAVGAAMMQGDWRWLCVSLVMGVLVVLTSQFAIQVMLFFSLVLSMYLGRLEPIGIFILAGCVCYAVPQLGGRVVLRHMIHHKLWYLRNYSRHPNVRPRRNFINLLLLPYMMLRRRAVTQLVFVHNALAIALHSATMVLIVTVIMCSSALAWDAVHQSPVLLFVWSVVLASLVCFALTSLRWLCWLGQAERYFEYGAPAACLLLPVLISGWDLPYQVALLGGLLVLSLAVIERNYRHLRRHGNVIHEKEQAVRNTAAWCAENLTDARIIASPIKMAFLISSEFRKSGNTSCKFYYRFILRPNEWGFRHYERDTASSSDEDWNYDLIRRPTADLCGDYGATHLVVWDDVKCHSGTEIFREGELGVYRIEAAPIE